MADPYTLESVIAWLETKNPAEEYDWTDCKRCACAQYFDVGDDWDVSHQRLAAATGVRLDGLAIEKPWNFGALLDRARAALSSHQAGQTKC